MRSRFHFYLPVAVVLAAATGCRFTAPAATSPSLTLPVAKTNSTVLTSSLFQGWEIDRAASTITDAQGTVTSLEAKETQSKQEFVVRGDLLLQTDGVYTQRTFVRHSGVPDVSKEARGTWRRVGDRHIALHIQKYAEKAPQREKPLAPEKAEFQGDLILVPEGGTDLQLQQTEGTMKIVWQKRKIHQGLRAE